MQALSRVLNIVYSVGLTWANEFGPGIFYVWKLPNAFRDFHNLGRCLGDRESAVEAHPYNIIIYGREGSLMRYLAVFGGWRGEREAREGLVWVAKGGASNSG